MLTCPYCEDKINSNDDGSPQHNHERTCPICNKTFLYQIEYYPRYTEWKAPCLNGETHSYKEIVGVSDYFKNRRRCEWCEDEIVIEE